MPGQDHHHKNFENPSQSDSSRDQAQADVLVVGGGIAGSTTAAILAQSGLAVCLFDPAPAHDGHLAAALTPVITKDNSPRTQLNRLAAELAGQWWHRFAPDVVMPCGAIQLQRPEGARRVTDLKTQAQSYAQPHWARWVERDEATDLAGLPLPRGGIWYPGAWLVRVPPLIAALQSVDGVAVRRLSVDRVQSTSGGWIAHNAEGQPIGQARALVLANAFDALGLLVRSGLTGALHACERLSAMHRLAGEVTALPAEAVAGGPRCIVGGDGYVLPAVDGWCVSGGTYVRDASEAVCSTQGRMLNVLRAGELLGMDVKVPPDVTLPGWAGWRAVLPGRLPAIGPLPTVSGLWVNTAGASRGLTWSVLGASLIRDQLRQNSDCLEPSLLELIRP